MFLLNLRYRESIFRLNSEIGGILCNYLVIYIEEYFTGQKI